MEKKTRNWCQIVYPETLPENWLTIVSNFHIPAAISPLHESELMEEGQGKPHYHIIYHFDGPKTQSVVQEIVQPLNGTSVFPVESINAYTRYLTHLDNKDKQQFVETPIILSGFDYQTYIEANSYKQARYNYISEMIEFVQTHDIVEFHQLFEYALMNRRDDWFPMLCDNSAYIVGEYIKSWRHSVVKERYVK